MEHLQNKNTKALIIVEGERLEPRFFEKYVKEFNIGFELYLVGANIYDLYKRIKEYDFNCDIRDVLPTLGNKVEGMSEILQQKFAYTYLVFDFDAHHKEIGEDSLDIDIVVRNNIEKLREMAKYFTNETDPGIGRLYINYPMMESFRDCNDFYDETYKDNEILIDDIPGYKAIAGQKKLSSIHINNYTKENFVNLTKLNVFKLNKITSNLWDKLSYYEYVSLSSPISILEKQSKRVQTNRMIGVLNTALFVGLDYYGNRNDFYDNLIGINDSVF